VPIEPLDELGARHGQDDFARDRLLGRRHEPAVVVALVELGRRALEGRDLDREVARHPDAPVVLDHAVPIDELSRHLGERREMIHLARALGVTAELDQDPFLESELDLGVRDFHRQLGPPRAIKLPERVELGIARGHRAVEHADDQARDAALKPATAVATPLPRQRAVARHEHPRLGQLELVGDRLLHARVREPFQVAGPAPGNATSDWVITGRGLRSGPGAQPGRNVVSISDSGSMPKLRRCRSLVSTPLVSKLESWRSSFQNSSREASRSRGAMTS
jgi:hypothetical protein